MELKEINCLYGSEQQKSILFVYGSWYVCEGSVNVNQCSDSTLLIDGVDIEELEDIDCFTAQEGIKSLEELEKFIDEE